MEAFLPIGPAAGVTMTTNGVAAFGGEPPELSAGMAMDRVESEKVSRASHVAGEAKILELMMMGLVACGLWGRMLATIHAFGMENAHIGVAHANVVASYV